MYEADEVTVVPSWYGATSREAAIFESVFHDFRPSDRAPRVQPNEYVDRILSPVSTLRDLTLVDLTTPGLHAIGISRAAPIESRSRRYPWTNGIAKRLRAGAPHADGFVWVSRAMDSARCVVLFADRDRVPMIGPDPTGDALALGAGTGLEFLRALAIGPRITIGVPSARGVPLVRRSSSP